MGRTEMRRGIWWRNWNGDHFEYKGVDERIILNCIFKK
jgi:hypothetical protein